MHALALTRRLPFKQAVVVDDVAAVAQRYLACSGYAFLRHITCHFENGILTLEGEVPSFFLKQLAQETVRGLPSVRQTCNHIIVSGR